MGIEFGVKRSVMYGGRSTDLILRSECSVELDIIKQTKVRRLSYGEWFTEMIV